MLLPRMNEKVAALVLGKDYSPSIYSNCMGSVQFLVGSRLRRAFPRQVLFYFFLRVVCLDEYGHVLYACSDVTAEQPLAWRKLQCFLQYAFVNHEGLTHQRAIVWSRQSSHKIGVQLL